MRVAFGVVLLVCCCTVYTSGCEFDCTLSGTCISNQCHCDPGWKGKACEQLDLLPAHPNQHAYQYDSHTTTWGGAPIQDTTGHYHLFAAQLKEDCPVKSWKSNSFIVHATSSTLLGPYKYKRSVIPTTSHGPQIAIAPDGTYVMYFIGEALNVPKNCTPSTPEDPDPPGHPGVACHINIATASNPNGTWTVVRRTILPWNNNTNDPWSCPSNPSPLILSNGTVMLYFRSSSKSVGGEIIGLATAPNFLGPYHIQGRLLTPHNEDPFIFQSPRGHFLMLLHKQKPNPTTAVGAKAYSIDGWNWNWAGKDDSDYQHPYTLDVQIGKQQGTFTRRERPQIFFDSSKNPMALFNGVQPGKLTVLGQSPQYTFVQEVVHSMERP